MASIINAATSGGLVTTADTSGILQLQTAGTTAVTVDASQNVTLVGSLSTTGVISAVISGGTANPGNAFWFSDNSASAMMYARQNGAGDLFALSAGATEKFRVTAAGVAEVASGVKFPATQSASANANTLDDYEEGTWTPTIYGSSTAGTGTYDKQDARYIKIGGVVSFVFDLLWTAHTGTGDMNVAGLPFTVNVHAAIAPGYVDNITLTASNILQSLCIDGSTNIGLRQTPVGGGSLSGVTLDTSGRLMISGTYLV